MTHRTLGLAVTFTLTVTIAGLASLAGREPSSQAAAPSPTRDYPVQPVPFTAVHLNDRFWAPKIETNRVVSIPFAFEQCELSGRVDNFMRAAAALRGETLTNTKPPGYPFDDTDPYKVIEGASYSLSVHPDPKLEAYVDDLISKIAAAQEPDGYLYTTRTINPQSPHAWAGKERWELERDDSHELYNLGHLFEAACAHYQATGKRTLLDVAIKSADLLVATFGPGKKSIWPGHQITEMGLAKLYRVTGDERYRKSFLHHWASIRRFDMRNTGGFSSGEQATGNPYAELIGPGEDARTAPRAPSAGPSSTSLPAARRPPD